jgi:hypothetical protein
LFNRTQENQPSVLVDPDNILFIFHLGINIFLFRTAQKGKFGLFIPVNKNGHVLLTRFLRQKRDSWYHNVVFSGHKSNEIACSIDNSAQEEKQGINLSCFKTLFPEQF